MEKGLPELSLLADGFDGAAVHLAHRDVKFLAISRATLPEIETFKKRMGWRFSWVSSLAMISITTTTCRFRKRSGRRGRARSLQLRPDGVSVGRGPGPTCLYKNAAGEVFHTYSGYARGLDPLIGTYNWLDLAPKGRDEDGLAHSMAWVRHHDKYVDGEMVDVKALYVQPARVEAS